RYRDRQHRCQPRRTDETARYRRLSIRPLPGGKHEPFQFRRVRWRQFAAWDQRQTATRFSRIPWLHGRLRAFRAFESQLTLTSILSALYPVATPREADA